MSEYKKTTKHVGEQRPLNQNPKPVDNNQSSNNGNSGNPIKPQETQKGLKPKK